MSKRRRTTVTARSVGSAVSELDRVEEIVPDKLNIESVLQEKGVDTSSALLHEAAQTEPERVHSRGKNKRKRDDHVPDASELGLPAEGPAMTVTDLRTIHNALLKQASSLHPLDKPLQPEDRESAHNVIMHALSNNNLGCLPELHLAQTFQPVEYWTALLDTLRPSAATAPSNEMVMHEVSREHFQERMQGYLGQEGEQPCIYFRADRHAHRANTLADGGMLFHGQATEAVGCQFSALCMTQEHSGNPLGNVPGVAYRTPDDMRQRVIRRGACIMCMWVASVSMLYTYTRDHLPTHPATMPERVMKTSDGKVIPVCINPFYVKTGANEFSPDDCVANVDNLMFGPFPQFSERFLRCTMRSGGVPAFELVSQSFRCRDKEAAREAIRPDVRMYVPPVSASELLPALFRRICAATDCNPNIINTWEHAFEHSQLWQSSDDIIQDFPPPDRSLELIDECLQIFPNPLHLPPLGADTRICWILYVRIHEAWRCYTERQGPEFVINLHALRVFVQAHKPLSDFVKKHDYPTDDVVLALFPWHTDSPDLVFARSATDQQFFSAVPSVPLRITKIAPYAQMVGRAELLERASGALRLTVSQLQTVVCGNFEDVCKLDFDFDVLNHVVNGDEFMRLPWEDAVSNRVTACALMRVGVAYAIMRACVELGDRYCILYDTKNPLSIRRTAAEFGRAPQTNKTTSTSSKSQNVVNRDRAFDNEMSFSAVNPLFVPDTPVRNVDFTHIVHRVCIKRVHRGVFMAAKKFISTHLDLLTYAVTFRAQHGRFPTYTEWEKNSDSAMAVSPLWQFYPWEYRTFHPGHMADHSEAIFQCAMTDAASSVGINPLVWQLYKACNIFNTKNGHPLAIPFEDCLNSEETMLFLANVAYFTYSGMYPTSCTFIPLRSWLHLHSLWNPWSPVASPRHLAVYLTKHTIKTAIQEHMFYQINSLPYAMPILRNTFYHVDENILHLFFTADTVRMVNAPTRFSEDSLVASNVYTVAFRYCLPKFPSTEDVFATRLIERIRRAPNSPILLRLANTQSTGKKGGDFEIDFETLAREEFVPAAAARVVSQTRVVSQRVLQQLTHLHFSNDLFLFTNQALQVQDAFTYPCSARSAPFFKCISLLMRAFTTADGVTHNKEILSKASMPAAYDYVYAYKMMLRMLQAEDSIEEHPAWIDPEKITAVLPKEYAFHSDDDVYPIGDPRFEHAPPMDVDLGSAGDVVRMDPLLNTWKLPPNLMHRTIGPKDAHPIAHVRYELTKQELDNIRTYIMARMPQEPIRFSELEQFGISQRVIEYLYHLEDVLCLVPAKNVRAADISIMTPKELYTLYAICAIFMQHYSTGAMVFRYPELMQKQADAVQRAMRLPLTQMREDFATVPMSTQCGRVACKISSTFIGNKGVVQRDGVLYPSERRPNTRRTLFYFPSSKCSMVPQLGCIGRFPHMPYRPPKLHEMKTVRDGKSKRAGDTAPRTTFKRVNSAARKQHGDGGYGAVHKCLATTPNTPLFTFCGHDTRFITSNAFVAPAVSITRVQEKNISHIVLADCCGVETPYGAYLFGQWENKAVMWCGNCYSVYNTRQLSTVCSQCGNLLNQDTSQTRSTQRNRVRIDPATGLLTVFFHCSYCD